MFKEDPQDVEAKKVFGTTRTFAYFLNRKDRKRPLMLEKNGWCLHYFNTRPEDWADYVIYRKKDFENASHVNDRLPVIEFRLKKHTLDFKGWAYGTLLDNIPVEANEMIIEFQEQFKTTDTKPVPVRYLKLYIAVLDEVPDYMTPTLVAHSVLGAHQEWVGVRPGNYNTDVYDQWLYESFRKCVIRVNRREFEKIKQLNQVYLGYENTVLNAEKSCAIPLPIWNDNIPNVLKFAKLWKPLNV